MKKTIGILAILAVLAFFCQATWAGEHIKEVQLPNGVKAYQYHKTSFFGQDYAGTTLVGPTSEQPPILRLQYGSTTVSETTTTFSRCKEKKDGRLTQAYFVGEEKRVIKQAGFQDAVNPANGQPPWTATIGGSGASTGNLLLPALVMGGAMVGSAGIMPGTNIAIGGAQAVVKGVSATGGKGGDSINKNTNINPNTNITKVNTVSGSSSSSSAGAAAATN
jgi:hypothetical protein